MAEELVSTKKFSPLINKAESSFSQEVVRNIDVEVCRLNTCKSSVLIVSRCKIKSTL